MVTILNYLPYSVVKKLEEFRKGMLDSNMIDKFDVVDCLSEDVILHYRRQGRITYTQSKEEYSFEVFVSNKHVILWLNPFDSILSPLAISAIEVINFNKPVLYL